MRHPLALAFTICVASACTLARGGIAELGEAEDAADGIRDDRAPPSQVPSDQLRDGASQPASQADASAGPRPVDAGTALEDANTNAPPSTDAAAPTKPSPKEDSDRFDWGAGDYPPALEQQSYRTLDGVLGPSGQPREYKVHVPSSYDRKKAAPIVYAFHGIGQNAVTFVVQGTDLVAKSEREGFILVMPNGVQEGGGSWNGGLCCGLAASQRVDDVAFVRALHAELSLHLHIDARRVYATGFSNGGMLVYRLACEAADLFAAVAPVAAALGTNDVGTIAGPTGGGMLASCKPSRPVALLALHGAADPLIPVRAMRLSVQHLATESGCSTSDSPAQEPASGGDTTCVTRADCKGKVEVTACHVEGGGHCWFGSPTCGAGSLGGAAFAGRNSDHLHATDAAWAFFERAAR
jgi:polyhydroxybutyrate depolymerase